MTLIIVKNKRVLSIPFLWRAVLKYIFDENNMNSAEIREMQESIVNWQSAINVERDKISNVPIIGSMLSDHRYSEEEFQLENMAKMLDDNNSGSLANKKEFFVKHNIDYRKYYRLPEAYTPADFRRADNLAEQHKQDFPEDYA